MTGCLDCGAHFDVVSVFHFGISHHGFPADAQHSNRNCCFAVFQSKEIGAVTDGFIWQLVWGERAHVAYGAMQSHVPKVVDSWLVENLLDVDLSFSPQRVWQGYPQEDQREADSMTGSRKHEMSWFQ